MLLKPAPGAKVLANMGNMVTSAWYAMGREACWWHSLPTSARTVRELGHRRPENFWIDARSAEAQAGHMFIKTLLPHDEHQHAT